MLRLWPQHAKSLLQRSTQPRWHWYHAVTTKKVMQKKWKSDLYPKRIAGSLLRLGVLIPELGRLRLLRSNPSILPRLGHSSSSANAINFTNWASGTVTWSKCMLTRLDVDLSSWPSRNVILQFANQETSKNALSTVTIGLESSSNSHMSFRSVILISANVETFCHVLPDGNKMMTLSHL